MGLLRRTNDVPLDRVEMPLRFLIPTPSCLFKPPAPIIDILLHAITDHQHPTDVVLGLRKALLGSCQEPVGCCLPVQAHALPKIQLHGEVVLCFHVALLGCQHQETQRILDVLLDAVAEEKHAADLVLGLSQALLGGLHEPVGRARRIPLHHVPGVQHDCHAVLRMPVPGLGLPEDLVGSQLFRVDVQPLPGPEGHDVAALQRPLVALFRGQHRPRGCLGRVPWQPDPVLGHDAQVVLRLHMAFLCGAREPPACLSWILLEPFAVEEHDSNCILRLSVPVLSGLQETLRRFRIVWLSTLTSEKSHALVVLLSRKMVGSLLLNTSALIGTPRLRCNLTGQLSLVLRHILR
mmetsp:Transcript_31206/g.89442  ORF Transcript_31206/g.89442 Transcript_31206/m.89442 type:complete len:349 (+) Transcript_31206:88-1134(+)